MVVYDTIPIREAYFRVQQRACTRMAHHAITGSKGRSSDQGPMIHESKRDENSMHTSMIFDLLEISGSICTSRKGQKPNRHGHPEKGSFDLRLPK